MLKFGFGWFLVAFFYIFGGYASASVITGKEASCGVDKKCDPGYACIGAVGQAESGVCVANGVSVVMCRFTDYFSSKIVRLFVLFGVVFLGIFAWIGKLAWLAIISFILGTGVLLGGQKLLEQLISSNTGFCSVEKALKCLDEPGSIRTIEIPHKNTYVIRNLKRDDMSEITVLNGGQKEPCTTLGCVRAKCPNFRKEDVMSGNPPAKTGEKCVKTQGEKEKMIRPGQKECGDSSLGCREYSDGSSANKDLMGSYPRDYFVCQNLCTAEGAKGMAFVVEGPAGKYRDCQEFVKKNMVKK